MSRESGYYVFDVVRNTQDLALGRRDNADKYDAAVDNVNKEIWFLQEKKAWSSNADLGESKLFKYSFAQKQKKKYSYRKIRDKNTLKNQMKVKLYIGNCEKTNEIKLFCINMIYFDCG